MSKTENVTSGSKKILNKDKSLDNPEYFINRELSWIRFNSRVLEEARDPWHPLLERVKFIAICGSNLDEFFMTRIARLLKKTRKGTAKTSKDGMTAMEQIQATRAEILPLLENHAQCWSQELMPALASEAIYIKKFKELTEEKKQALRDYLKNTILPAMDIPKKQGLDPSKTENLHLNLAVQIDSPKKQTYYVVAVPTEKFDRLIRIPSYGYSLDTDKPNEGTEFFFVFLEDLIANNLDLLFPKKKAVAAYPFRLTRNGEIDIIMDESADFLVRVKRSLTNRKSGFPSRLEFDKNMPQSIRIEIAQAFKLPDYLTYEFDGPLGLVDFWQLTKLTRTDLKDKTFLPNISPILTSDDDLLGTIAKRDIVLYHPYDGFEVIVELLREAATDRYVKEICITMYRMDPKSPVVETLIAAAKQGKRVTAVIELKAKFDEENNIVLASLLRESGVKVVYNFPNFKVHAKLCLIVRKTSKETTRFSHIGSGNYNSVTAKIYGDIGYLTANPEIGKELEELFKLLVKGKQEKEFKHLLVAPKSLKPEILRRINREIEFHQKTGKGYLAFKLNNLEETEVIQALYRASMAGIKIDLNVRGLCCLRPGIPGVSENISVVSIVGRFLEHARIYYFRNGKEDEVLIGSSDLMFRNLNERVEVLLSVPDPKVRQAILDNMLKIHLKDNIKARRLMPDGTYQRVEQKRGDALINSQGWLIENRGIWHEQQA
ncbi:MAG: polyphosphate kinase 1 [Candidatus Bathyarchaeota archaeon]|nr:polyphosphate kinase 1 [Candidatus Bathyarchaeota archaeon]